MKFFLQKTLTLAFFKLCVLLPWPALRRLSQLLALLLLMVPNAQRRNTRVNIALCYPQLSVAEQKKRVQQSLQHTVLTALEIPRIWQQPVASTLASIVAVSGRELIDSARQQGRGVIVIAPHLGNWECLGYYLAQHYPITCLFRPQQEAWRNSLIHQGRSRCGTRLQPTNRKGVLAIVKALKAGEVTGILPDQVPDIDSGVEYAPFFGRPAATMTLVSSLLQRGNIVAVAGFARRLDNGLFEIVFQSVDEALYSPDRQLSACALNRTVEQLIGLAPEQYQWEYKRFRRGPGGKKTSYYR